MVFNHVAEEMKTKTFGKTRNALIRLPMKLSYLKLTQQRNDS